MLSINVRVSHNYDLIVSQILDVLVFAIADVDADGGDETANLGVIQQIFDAGLFDVERFAAQRQNGLETTIAAGLRRAAGGIAFDQEQFGGVRIAFGAVEQLARQTAAGKDTFAVLQGLLGLGRGFARLGCHRHFFDDLLGVLGVLFEIFAQLLVDDADDNALDLGVEQADLVLRFKLRIGVLDADDGRYALAVI